MTTGLYSKFRHPIYLFGGVAYGGLFIAWGEPVPLVLFLLIYPAGSSCASEKRMPSSTELSGMSIAATKRVPGYDLPESLRLRILNVDTKGGGKMATMQLAKWGNSLALRIPKPLAEDAQLREGDPVTVTIRGRGTLVIKAARRRYRLEQLVSRITARNRHEETDWGGPQGREVW